MPKRLEEIESPVNANERFLHSIAIRLDVLIDQMSSILTHIAPNVANVEITTETTATQPPVRGKRAPRKE